MSIGADGQLLYIGLAALALVQTLLLAATIRRQHRSRRSVRPHAGGDASRSAGIEEAGAQRIDSGDPAGTITCPKCDTPNEQGYRFCRGCVGELPGWDLRARHPPAGGRGSVW